MLVWVCEFHELKDVRGSIQGGKHRAAGGLKYSGDIAQPFSAGPAAERKYATGEHNTYQASILIGGCSRGSG